MQNEVELVQDGSLMCYEMIFKQETFCHEICFNINLW